MGVGGRIDDVEKGGGWRGGGGGRLLLEFLVQLGFEALEMSFVC